MIAQTIRKLRLERSFTQEYVALELGISQNAYCKIENGQVQLTVERLEKIAVILDVPMATLFAGMPAFNDHLTQEEQRQAIIHLLQGELQAKQKVVDELLDIIKEMQGRN
jgi:transcriptional regulator with XRE-family HTH domain